MSGGPGRPRHTGHQGAAVPPRDEILDVAARLFASKGVANTSTREIAETIGIRQASLYYHFAGKDAIVEELLERSLRPTLDKIEKVELLGAPHGTASPAALLYLLLLLDVRTLARAPHNAGVLARLPEVQKMPYFGRYQACRSELGEAYGRLGSQARAEEALVEFAPPPTAKPGTLNLGSMLLQLAEVVVRMRVGGREVTPPVADQIARSGLRLCGISSGRVDAAAEEAAPLIGVFDEL
ncbi:TetR/AcrR family transcriptional regulator [Nocardioides panzhihuensis]|uniref:AcrR family transcriptional regulator n=1 Tax=Nocardioides panzhihuensis TaxID=860243 RepID=A0A7Z0DSX9_9ACTN|nr:helix-turn-helix domain-containing protein [Nocardioides panzhihuensis]NYI81194.1 AcrR family transcriptional regulator [Nocardioides panzhihuensis]